MNQSINHKLKIDFLISNNTSLNHPTHTAHKPKRKYKKCNECNRSSIKDFNEIHQICHLCYKAKTVQSRNKVIDDFISYTVTNNKRNPGRMEFVPYDRFKNVEFLAEGGFSKIYKAIWIDGPISNWSPSKQRYVQSSRMKIALKELSNSKNINPNELNELNIFYKFSVNQYINKYYQKTKDRDIGNINKYYGITQHPITKNFMIISSYYESGDLTHYITNKFFDISWKEKLLKLNNIISGLYNIHRKDIIHKDYHSGNIFISDSNKAITGDLGLSKSATESDNDDEIYGIIPYVAPEIFQGQKYTKASDIYSIGMIMWELMTGRRPFWDKSHDTDLIIKICDGLRPPIVTNAPEGYIDLIQKCWHSDPNERPAASKIQSFFNIGWKDDKHFIEIVYNEEKNPTKIIKSPDIGPIQNNPDAIYKSRSLSAMIKSANSTISLKSIISDIGSHYYNQNNNNDKRKFNENNNDKDKITKRIKSYNEYLTKEFEFDIDGNISSSKPNNDDYATKEIDFDI